MAAPEMFVKLRLKKPRREPPITEIDMVIVSFLCISSSLC
jgi:hypothetical protein